MRDGYWGFNSEGVNRGVGAKCMVVMNGIDVVIFLCPGGTTPVIKRSDQVTPCAVFRSTLLASQMKWCQMMFTGTSSELYV